MSHPFCPGPVLFGSTVVGMAVPMSMVVSVVVPVVGGGVVVVTVLLLEVVLVVDVSFVERTVSYP